MPVSTATTAFLHAHPSRVAQELFHERTGGAASHVVYAPGRVNLIGEHTDYTGGFVLPMAIEPGLYLAARVRADRRVRVWSALRPEEPAEFAVDAPVPPGKPAWSNYVRGVIAGLQAAGASVPGFDAVVHATLPGGGGLSSSAALEVATATLGELLAGITLDPEQKALLCQKAEHEFAGTPCGIMDQFAVVFGKRGHLLLLDCQSRVRTLVPMRGDDVALLVINTMVRHELNDGGYRARRDDCLEAARLLGVRELRDATATSVDEARALLPERIFRRARHVTTENVRTLAAVEALRAGEWRQLGVLMGASHDSLRDDFNVSCAELDAIVAAARELGPERGVFGCRMTGGGFGGCCIALVQAARVREVEDALRASYLAATGIEPVIFATQPADGPAVLLQP
ncbi:MAG: galactokinase [Chthoniobacter sp.]|nr:galactokinase [Chthoniobacter sp.]